MIHLFPFPAHFSHAAGRHRSVTLHSALLLLSLLPEAAPAQPTVSEIRDVWQRQEGRSGTLRVVVQRSWQRAEGHGPPAHVLERMGLSPPPALSYVEQTPCTILLSGGAFRFERESLSIQQRLSGKPPNTRISTSDTEQQMLFNEGESLEYPSGVVERAGGSTSDSEAAGFYPLMLLYRMSRLVPENASLTILPDVEARGTSCFTVRHERSPSDVDEYTIDAHDWSRMYRWTRRASDRLVNTVEFFYDDAALPGVQQVSTPAAWETTEFSRDGSVASVCRSDVVKFDLNPSLSPSDFTIGFPPGTWVEDRISGQHYLILEDGSKRIISDQERRQRIPYDVLLSTETGAAAEHHTDDARWMQMILAANVLVLLLIVGSALSRRWRPRT